MKSLPSDATVKNVRKGIISSGLTARYKHISAIRFADSSFSSRSFLLPVRNKNDRYATSGKRTVGWVIRIVEKFVKKKNPPVTDITMCPPRRTYNFRPDVESSSTYKCILHTRPFRCRETRLAMCPAVSWAVCLR